MQTCALHHQVDVTSVLLYTHGGLRMRRVITKQLVHVWFFVFVRTRFRSR